MSDRQTSWRYTLANRVWHWLVVLVMLGIVETVLVRLVFFEKNHIAALISHFLSERGASFTEMDSFDLAKLIRNQVWKWHVVFGHTLAFLFLFKVAHMMFFRYVNSEVSSDALGKIRNGMTQLIMTLLLVMLISGEVMFFVHGHSFLSEIAYAVHGFTGLYLFFPTIALHIVLVFCLEVKSKSFRGTVSKMIGGNKNE